MKLRPWWMGCVLVSACRWDGGTPGCDDASCANDSSSGTPGSTDGASTSGTPDAGSTGASLDPSTADVGETTDTPGGTSSGDNDPGDSSSGGNECRTIGDPCEHDGECCLLPDWAAVCVAEEDGGRCRPACADDSECESGCCTVLHGGGAACLAPEYCAHDCPALLAACDEDAPCCEGTTCEAEACTIACTEDAQCPSGCCSDEGRCVDAAACDGSEACDKGRHFCTGGTALFVCDDDAWYPVDCEAACIDAGWIGTSGCEYSDIWDDDVCLCIVDETTMAPLQLSARRR